MDKIISCCDCEYQEICHNFDAFWGCSEGELRELNAQPLLNEREDSEILLGKTIENMLGDN